MSKREEIRVTIEEDGGASVEVKNMAGKSCVKATEGLELYLGSAGQRELTPDYYKKEKQKEAWITRQN